MERRVPETERDIILQLANGTLPSPATFMNAEFFVVRISGTGCAWRAQLRELVWREPQIWLSPEMQQRCVGLPVVVGHPALGTLDTKEFLQRVIGVIVFAFVRDQDLMGVMRCLDRDAAAELINGEYDSSPAVVLDGTENAVLEIDGTKLLVEGEPRLIDHLAICKSGVWTGPNDQPGIEISQAA
jgi:hypothetical protein